ncbi:hypothetical protein M8C21_001696, partial [Ambrosia artemisiifolia]
IRVIFQLCEEIPCVSPVVVALLSEPEPKIDYTLKGVGGSLTAIPGLSNMIDLIVEDHKETQFAVLEVMDQDIGQDRRLGIAKLPLFDLEPETEKDIELRLLPSLDMLKIKDKKYRGTLTIMVKYHHFSKEEQDAAMEQQKKILEEKKRLKAEGLIGSTMDAIDGAAGLVGSCIGTGVGLVGSGLGLLVVA